MQGMRSDRILRVACAILLTVGLAACGGEGSKTPAPASPSAASSTAVAAPVLPTDPRELPDFNPTSFDALLADASAGIPVVVTFYSSRCGPCRREAPLFADMDKQYGDHVQFIGVDMLDTKVEARRFLDGFGITYPSVFDPSSEGDILSSFGFAQVPATLFIGYGGEEVSRYEGEIDADRLERSIRPLLPSA
jgi:thiol-disulfide isomerase/thioredoxin